MKDKLPLETFLVELDQQINEFANRHYYDHGEEAYSIKKEPAEWLELIFNHAKHGIK